MATPGSFRSMDPDEVSPVSRRLGSPITTAFPQPGLSNPAKSRIAFFVSPSLTSTANAIAERVKTRVGVDVEWFIARNDGHGGGPAVHPTVLGADALCATLCGHKKKAGTIRRDEFELNTKRRHSPASLIAKGEAAVRLGDHARANSAFAEARAAREEMEMGRTPGKLTNENYKLQNETAENALAVANAFAPYVLTLVDDEPSMHAVLDVLSKGNSAGGGILVNLHIASEQLVTDIRNRCQCVSMAFVQCALLTDDVESIANGTVEAWIASADGAHAMAAAETVVLNAVCGGSLRGDAYAYDETPLIRRVESNDPRDCATPRAAVTASLLVAQIAEMRDMERRADLNSRELLNHRKTSAAAETEKQGAAGELQHLKHLLEVAEKHGDDLSARLADETKQGRLVGFELKQLEIDHRRDLELLHTRRETQNGEVQSSRRENADLTERLQVLTRALDTSKDQVTQLTSELASVEISCNRFETETSAEADKARATVTGLRDALAAARADAEDARRELRLYEKGAVGGMEDLSIARDMAETDATETRGRLAEAVTEVKRWRARCDAAERRALDAEKRAEREAMRAVVADAKAASYHETMENGIVNRVLVVSDGPGVGVTRNAASSYATPQKAVHEAFPDSSRAVVDALMTQGQQSAIVATVSETPPASALADSFSFLTKVNETETVKNIAALEKELRDLREASRVTTEKLEIAESACKNALVREASADTTLESAHDSERGFQLATAGLRRRILETAADLKAAQTNAKSEVDAAFELLQQTKQECDTRITREVDLRLGMEVSLTKAMDEARQARRRADQTRVEAETAFATFAASPDVTSVSGEEDVTTKKQGWKEIVSEREALFFAQLTCQLLERQMPGARACLARRSFGKKAKAKAKEASTPKISVVAAGAMSPLVTWFSARGWSSTVYSGSLVHDVLGAMDEPGGDGKHDTRSNEVRRVSYGLRNPGETRNSQNATLFENVTSFRLAKSGDKTSDDANPNHPGVAVACGTRGDLVILVECSTRVAQTSLVELTAIHAAADSIANAFDASDDASYEICKNLFALLRVEMENSVGTTRDAEPVFIEKPFESMDEAVQLLEQRRAQRSFAEKRLRQYWRGGVGALRRVVSHPFLSFGIPKDLSAQVLVTATKAAGAVSQVSFGMGNSGDRFTKESFAAAAKAFSACELIRAEASAETELARTFGIRPMAPQNTSTLAKAVLDKATSAKKAASHAARVWRGRDGDNGGGEASDKKNVGVRAVADALVFGDDGVDVMHARHIELCLGHERDLFDADLLLRQCTPLVAAMLFHEDDEDGNEAPHNPTTKEASLSLWLWTAVCLSTWRLRKLIKQTERAGVFDNHIVDSKLKMRQAAGQIIGRYWKTHSARFFCAAAKKASALKKRNDTPRAYVPDL